jgi:uncharacterized protein YndB with AHSA1/START domain
MATLYHEVWIKAPTAKVFWAISTADGISAWWEKQTAALTPQGIVLEHNPGPEHGAVKMKVLDLTQNKRVEWECISTHSRSTPALHGQGRMSFSRSVGAWCLGGPPKRWTWRF